MTSEHPENEHNVEGEAWQEATAGYGAVNENQPGDQQAQDPDLPATHASNGDTEEEQQGNGEDGADDGGDYDPESITIPSVQTLPEPSQPAAQVSPPKPKPAKPKTSGGFIMTDSDDEDDPPTSGNAAGQTLNVPQGPPPDTSQSPGQEPVAASATPSNHGNQTAIAGPTSASAPREAHVVSETKEASDHIGRLEDRVKEDPRGDMDAWLALIAEHRRLNQVDALRDVYERFVKVFPQAADIWVDWINMELDCMNTTAAESLFQRSLLSVPNVQLWTTYINYIRRRNDLTKDPNGQARQVISQSYEFVIDNVGVDRDSGQLWKDWIQFIKSGPGQVGGSGWQDQQKMDQLRRAYHRAITVPMSSLTELWKDYDQFELGLNKTTGRQFIQKRSPGYMTAKASSLQLDRKISRLQRTTLPRLPPAPGFAGDQEFMEQVDLWNQWIQWEKDDPLVLKDEEPEAYKERVIYVYKQALMALRFWPEMWVDAAEWCFDNNVFKDGSDLGMKFLTDGIEANPESVLLALKHGDRIEMTFPASDSEESKAARAKAVRAPYDRVLDTLYKMMQKLKEREKNELAQIEQLVAAQRPVPNEDDKDNDNDGAAESSSQASAHQERFRAVKQGFAVQTDLLKRTISFVWIALCRAMRRTQGKGNPTSGLRGVFTEARSKGQLTSDVYVAVALIESVVYKDAAGGKIFDRGSKLFPEDEDFMLEYIKFLHSKDDTTNARVAFETCVNRLTQKPEKKDRAKRLYMYFHKYESQYGELASIVKLEKRMAELWPDDPKLSHFANRHSVASFDPIAYRLIVSPAVQMRPKIMPSIEQPAPSARNSPLPAPASMAAPAAARQTASPAPPHFVAAASPKRPLPADDQEEFNRPRKLARGESPLKGAAGRRLDQQRRNHGAPLSRDITFFLGILPPAHTYNAQAFKPANMVNLIRETTVPDYSTWKANQDPARRAGGVAAPATSHGRQASSGDYPPFGTYPPPGGRDSPNPRPLSPYSGGVGQRVASQTGYRNSPLRPESGTGFEAASSGYRQDVPMYQQAPPSQWAPPPPGQNHYEGSAPPSWAPPPAGYGAPPPQQYGQYQY